VVEFAGSPIITVAIHDKNLAGDEIRSGQKEVNRFGDLFRLPCPFIGVASIMACVRHIIF
jgi:hypothetical protein